MIPFMFWLYIYIYIYIYIKRKLLSFEVPYILYTKTYNIELQIAVKNTLQIICVRKKESIHFFFYVTFLFY